MHRRRPRGHDHHSTAGVLRAAEPYPTQTVTLVVPFPPGAITDNIARMLSVELAAAWKQSVVVENRPGASGMIGAGQVARAPKDGHTALFTITTHVQLPALMSKMPYDSAKDFVPVSQVALSRSILAVGPGFPAETMKDFIDKAKAAPGKHSYGSYGNGTTGHIYGELFKKQAGAVIAERAQRSRRPWCAPAEAQSAAM